MPVTWYVALKREENWIGRIGQATHEYFKVPRGKWEEVNGNKVIPPNPGINILKTNHVYIMKIKNDKIEL